MQISGELIDKAGLNQMVSHNTDNHETAFTVSVDAVDTTTGISAFERARTVEVLIDDNVKPEDLRRPGHMFPLRAKEGGVLCRIGHTEATVDLAKLAGLKPAGLCCEIMKEDGTMARTGDLGGFQKKHGLKACTVAQLIEYRRAKEKQIRLVETVKMPTDYGLIIILAHFLDFSIRPRY